MYHFIMVVIAFGFAAIFSYEYHATSESARNIIDIGRVTWWVSLVLIYFWSIIAQRLYPEQDFS